MYCQITTLCNMACAHCCYACGPKKPFQHMSERVYDQCLHLAGETGAYFQLGGGEPTCHPDFWQYLRRAVASTCEGVWLATNGKRTKHALALALLATSEGWYDLNMEYAEENTDEEDRDEYGDWRDVAHPWIDGTAPDDWEKFSVTLSDDPFHDPIDPRVTDTFRRYKHELRDVTAHGNRPSNVGASKENYLGGEDRCACTEIHIKPDGRVQLCGDDGSLPLGTVFDYTSDEWGDLLQRIGDTEDVHEQCGYFGLGRAVDEDGELIGAPKGYTKAQLDLVAEYIETGEGWDGESLAPWDMDQEDEAA